MTILLPPGIKGLIECLNGLFLRVALTVDCERYAAFDRYCIKSTTKIENYILEFEKSHNRISQKDMTLPSPVLTFNLLDSAKLSNHDRQIALTGVDYSQKNTLFTQIKNSLCKLHGEQALQIESTMKPKRKFISTNIVIIVIHKIEILILLHDKPFHHHLYDHYCNKIKITTLAFNCKINLVQPTLPAITADQSNVNYANLYSI